MTTTLTLNRTFVRAVGGLAATGLAVTLVAACSSGGSTSTTTPAPGNSVAQATSGGRPGATRSGGRRFDPAQIQKIRQCLEAAGIPLPSFSPRSFAPGERPSFTPGQRPSGFPSGVRPSGGRGFGGIDVNDPKVKQALEACGLVFPDLGQQRPDGAGDGGSVGSPTS